MDQRKRVKKRLAFLHLAQRNAKAHPRDYMDRPTQSLTLDGYSFEAK